MQFPSIFFLIYYSIIIVIVDAVKFELLPVGLNDIHVKIGLLWYKYFSRYISPDI
jgi:hypothetical protein